MEFKKKSKAALLVWIVAVVAMTGCATGTDGVVPIGPDMYMVGGHGSFTDFSGSAVKAKYYREAAAFCAQQNRVMVPMGSSGQDSDYGKYASAEVQFRCLKRDDPR